MFDNTGKIITISLIVSIIVSVIVSTVAVIFITPLLHDFKKDSEKSSVEMVEVPLVEGLDYEKAKIILLNKSLNLFVESEKMSDKEKGTILSQSPFAGTSVMKNSVINVVISSGKEIVEQSKIDSQKLVTLPYFVGLNIDEVKREIINLGLKIGDVKYVDDEKYRTDVVVSTDPVGGVKIPAGSAVNLNVSKGVVNVVVPNVNSLTKDDAKLKITNAGLFVEEIIYVTDVEYPFDIVIKQQPAPGTKVKKGTGVKIWINKERE
ncbi:MAG: PASTA domain-containing protein [candidate division WOR-3 bacterium]